MNGWARGLAGSLLIVVLLGVTACTTPPRPREPVPAAARDPLRQQAWAEVKRLARMFERVPPAECPGLATLAAQVRGRQRRIEAERSSVARVDQLDATALIARNPAFWQATSELAPSDPSITLFAALVHLAAGQPGHAQELVTLVRAGPLVPVPMDQVLFGVMVQAQVAPWPGDAGSRLTDPGATPERRLAVLRRLRDEYPEHPRVAWALISERLAAAGLGDDVLAVDWTQSVAAGVLADVAPLIEVVERAWPVRGAWLRTATQDPSAATRWGRVWRETGDVVAALGHKDLETLAEAWASAGLPVHALLARRTAAAARGFGLPTDIDFARRQLLRVLSDEDASRWQTWQDGHYRQVWFIGLDVAPDGSAWRPLHPLLAEGFERHRRARTYELEAAEMDPEYMVRAYAARAWNQLWLGHFAAAAADLERWVALVGDDAPARSLRFALALERGDSEAAAAVLSAQPHDAPPHPGLAHDRAMWHALRGEWREAGALWGAQARVAGDAERGAFYACHAAIALRFAAEPVPPELLVARPEVPTDAWVQALLAALRDPAEAAQLLAAAEAGASEVERSGRRCEALLVLAALAPPGSPEQVAWLEHGRRTGVSHFLEYLIAWFRLRELAPERWAPQAEPAQKNEAPVDEPPRRPGSGWDDAEPRWSVPA